MIPNLQTLPSPVTHLIYGHLTDARDRSSLASTCKKLYGDYITSLDAAYVRIQDHRPYLQHLKMQEEAEVTLQKSEGYKNIGICLSSIGCCSCVTGLPIAGSSSGCCCCTVSLFASKVLCYIGLSFFGAGCCFLGAAGAVTCCSKSRDQEVELVRQFNEEEDLISDFSKKLHIQRVPKGPKTVPPEPSYQGGTDLYAPN